MFQKILIGVFGVVLLCLISAVTVLSIKYNLAREEVAFLSERAKAYAFAAEQKDLLIDEKDKIIKSNEIMERYRAEQDKTVNTIKNEMKNAFKEVILHDPEVAAWLRLSWPDGALRVLDETRNRLFPGTNLDIAGKNATVTNPLPRTGRKQ